MQDNNKQHILFSKNNSVNEYEEMGKLLKKYPYSLNLQYKYLESAAKLGLHIDNVQFKRLSTYAIDPPFFKLKLKRISKLIGEKKEVIPDTNQTEEVGKSVNATNKENVIPTPPTANLISDFPVKQDTNEQIEIMAPDKKKNKSADQAPEDGQFTNWLESLKKSKRLKEDKSDAPPLHPDGLTRKKKKKKKKKKGKKRKKLLEFGSKQEDIISETLAELMAKQGYTDKAIEMYNRLSLLFPDKNAYFATKIEELQK